MGLMYRRPLFSVLSAFLFSAFISFFVSREIKLAAAAAFLTAAVVFVFIFIFGRRVRFLSDKRFLPLFAAFLLLFSSFGCTVSYFSFDVSYAEAHAYAGTSARAVCAVTEENGGGAGFSTRTVSVREINGSKTDFCALMSFPGGAPSAGDIFSAQVLFSSLSEYTSGNPLSLLSDGIMLGAECTGGYTVTGHETGITVFFSGLRASLGERIDAAAENATAGFLRAVLLGDKSSLEDSVQRDMSRCGVSHMLALSGLHLAVVAGGLEFILCDILLLHKKLRGAAVIAVSLGYAALTGFSPSVCRAAFMVVFAYAGFYLGREYDPPTGLALATFAIVLIRPYAILSAGLWLSFFATLAVLSVGSYMRDREITSPRRGFFPSLLSVLLFRVLSTIAALLATLPIVIFLYARLPVFSVAANLLIALPVEFMLYLGIYIVFFGNYLGAAYAAQLLYGLICRICSFISGSEYACITASGNALPVFALLAGAAVALAFLLRFKRRVFSLLLPAAVLLLFCAHSLCAAAAGGGELRALLVSSGGSDALVLRADEGAVIVEFSEGGSGILCRAANAAALDGSTEISALVYTSAGSRAASSFAVFADRYILRCVYLPENGSHNAAIAESAAQRGITVRRYTAGASESICGITAAIYDITPPGSSGSVIAGVFSAGGASVSYFSPLCFVCDPTLSSLPGAADADAAVIGRHGGEPAQGYKVSLPHACCVVFSDRSAASRVSSASITRLLGSGTRIILAPEKYRLLP